jgi:hypothetical protein
MYKTKLIKDIPTIYDAGTKLPLKMSEVVRMLNEMNVIKDDLDKTRHLLLIMINRDENMIPPPAHGTCEEKLRGALSRFVETYGEYVNKKNKKKLAGIAHQKCPVVRQSMRILAE